MKKNLVFILGGMCVFVLVAVMGVLLVGAKPVFSQDDNGIIILSPLNGQVLSRDFPVTISWKDTVGKSVRYTVYEIVGPNQYVALGSVDAPRTTFKARFGDGRHTVQVIGWHRTEFISKSNIVTFKVVAPKKILAE